MKNITSKIELGIGNRDGDVYAVAADDGKFYLVVTSETGCGELVFNGMRETSQVEISRIVFISLCRL